MKKRQTDAAHAANTKKKRAMWRTVTRGGKRALLSPEGGIYYGTPREIRECALMPWRRDALARSQKLARHMAATGAYSPDELRAVCAENRREAIRRGYHDAADGVRVPIPADVFIRLAAGARLVCGGGIDDFFAEIWRSEIDALLDIAESSTGTRALPLNRHERRALARCENAERAG